MRSVNIAELKNRLSAYITYAKAGETIVISRPEHAGGAACAVACE
jgi:antitoxin (DNA-binding transcriptional repressor) of toxin-antitoxin stability system